MISRDMRLPWIPEVTKCWDCSTVWELNQKPTNEYKLKRKKKKKTRRFHSGTEEFHQYPYFFTRIWTKYIFQFTVSDTKQETSTRCDFLRWWVFCFVLFAFEDHRPRLLAIVPNVLLFQHPILGTLGWNNITFSLSHPKTFQGST